MKHRDVAVILATGGMGLVRAAYSAGKPAYGVGPGQRAVLTSSARPTWRRRSRDIVTGKTFDNGVLCSSPNSVVVDDAVAEEVKREFVSAGRATSCRRPRRTRSRSVLVTPQRLPNPALVGKSGDVHRRAVRASRCRRTRACSSRELDGRRPRLSRCRSRSSARSSPTTSSRTGARAASAASRSCATAAWATRCRSTRRTTQVILEFGLKKPAFRIVVNTPTTHGSIGLTTGLDPAMTLGCGGYGGNITSDNISPRHLLNIKRLAYETAAGRRHARAAPDRASAATAPDPGLPQVAGRAATGRGRRVARASADGAAARDRPTRTPGQTIRPPAVVDFVCEEDVRQAIELGRKIVIGERTIVTPAARDLAEAQRVFVSRAGRAEPRGRLGQSIDSR